jgi:hypothetical protein
MKRILGFLVALSFTPQVFAADYQLTFFVQTNGNSSSWRDMNALSLA